MHSTFTRIDYWNPGPRVNDSRVQFIGHAGHTADMAAGRPTDPEALIQARRYELDSINGWLGIMNLFLEILEEVRLKRRGLRSLSGT